MHSFAVRSSPNDPSIATSNEDVSYIEIDGTEGTVLRATMTGLLVCACRSTTPMSTHGHRRWAYDDLADLRLDSYGPIGVVRARSGDGRTDLPLLLLEPRQITAARKGLEIISNLMASLRATPVAS
jgi:hypothetical protein